MAARSKAAPAPAAAADAGMKNGACGNAEGCWKFSAGQTQPGTN
jgi:hypothetical protein